MPHADTETTCIKGILQRVWTRPRNMAQTLVCRVDVLAEADRVEVGFRPACRDDNHVAGWQIVCFYKPAVPICALDFQAIIFRRRYSANHMFNSHERWLKRRWNEVPLWLCRPAIVNACPPGGYA